MSDKLRELTPVSIDFYSGERPTDEKLEGMMTQVDTAFDQLEDALGDLFGDTESGALWTTNIGRDLGDRSKLNPVVQPDILVSNYVQQLTAGSCEHELDLIPLGTGSAMLVTSSDSSVTVTAGNYKASEQLLLEPGDWTIRPGKVENNQIKNSRKLVTHSPSSGGTITFAQCTSGKGSTYHNSKHNVIPSLAQAAFGGPYLNVVLSNPASNIYTITLPLHNQVFDSTNSSATPSASNTKASVASGVQHELPSYFFDADGLNLLADAPGGGPKNIPLNSMQIWDWDEKKMIAGIEQLACSSNLATRKIQFTVQFAPDISLNTVTGKYLLSTSGTTVYAMLGAIQRELIFHKHDGDDLGRQLKHTALMGLRTGNTDVANRSAWYGASNIDNNDHPMYLHRDGFVNTDVGAGGNVMRGDLVVGSKTTGIASEHENYNLTGDSYAVAFGKNADGGKVYFNKARTHNLPEGRGNIAQNYTGTATLIEGAKNDLSPTIKTTSVDGNLRVSKDTVLGTSKDDDVLVSGDLYVHQSATLTPKSDIEIALIAGEEGKMVYSTIQKGPVYWNGSAWISVASTGYSAIVGDGITSYGRFNGNTDTAIQSAIAAVEALGGGRILILRGTYAFGVNSITLTTRVSLEGEGSLSLITSTGTAIKLASGSVSCAVKSLRITGATIGVEVQGSGHFLNDIDASSCTDAWIQRAGAANNNFGVIRSASFTNESTVTTNTQLSRIAVGYLNGPFTLNPVDKQGALAQFKKTSGVGTLSYEASTDSAIGFGRYAITGTGVWVIDAYMPVDPAVGVGGNISHKASVGGGSITVGVYGYNSSLTLLGTNGGFITNAATSTTTWAMKYNFARLEGTAANTLKVGTRFVRIYIEVTSNPGTIYVDSLNVTPMNFAALALYY